MNLITTHSAQSCIMGQVINTNLVKKSTTITQQNFILENTYIDNLLIIRE